MMNVAKKWKIAAVVAALVPIGFFLLFAIGEGFGGWSHYIQAIVPLIMILFAWRKPGAGGYIFAGLGLLFGILYVVVASNQLVATIALVELIVFMPMIASGYFFIQASK